MPPPLGLVNLSASDLIAAAGGDPWQINDELHAGDAGAINAQADAFHAAAGSATEVEDDFKSAKQRFEKGWRHNGTEHPITESAEVTYATETLRLQKPQLAKIALDLETVAAALVTAQRSCDGQIAALDAFLHGVDDQIGAAKADDQDTQGLHDAAVAAVQTTLGDVRATRDGYVATMTAAKASMEALRSAPGGDGGAAGLGVPGQDPAPRAEGDGGAGGLGSAGANPPGPAATGSNPPGPTPNPSEQDTTRRDVILGSAGAITGGTADGVGQATRNMLAQGPKIGPAAPSPSLTKFLENPKIGGVELKGFSRLGRVAGAAGAVPSVFADHADGNSWSEAVFREGVGAGVGIWAGTAAGAGTGAWVGTLIPVPGVGTAAGVVVGAGIGAIAAAGGSKLAGATWEWGANAVGSAIHGVKSVFGSG